YPRAILVFSLHHASTTQIYTLSLHDALPIYRLTKRLSSHTLHNFEEIWILVDESMMFVRRSTQRGPKRGWITRKYLALECRDPLDRKSTRLNSSHVKISYAVFCLKKKKKKNV